MVWSLTQTNSGLAHQMLTDTHVKKVWFIYFLLFSLLPPWLDAPPCELFIEILNQRGKLITKIYEAVIYSPLKEWDNTSQLERLNNQALTIFIWYHKAVCLKNDQATNWEMRMTFSRKTFWMRRFLETSVLLICVEDLRTFSMEKKLNSIIILTQDSKDIYKFIW